MSEPKIIFPPSERLPPPDAEATGQLDPNERLEITVVVRRKNPLPSGDERVTREEFADHYGADPADLAQVQEYAREQGLEVVSADAARRTVVLAGDAGRVSAAFGANLDRYQQGGRTFRARTGVLEIPQNLSGLVEGIFGFDQRPQARSRIRPALAVSTSFTPPQLAQVYDFPQGNTGQGQTVAIIELGGGYRDSDLQDYFSSLGITPPSVTSVAVDGVDNSPTGDPSGPDGEVLLDIEVVGAIAPGVNIAVYFAPNTTQGFLDAITTAVHDSQRMPSVISISWGGAESTWTAQALQSYDQAFADARVLGVTVCCASGDDGSADNQTDGQAHVDFPASSPNVLACGGTTLETSGGGIQDEVVWNNGAGKGASGGGVSEIFPLPDYQQEAGVPPSVNASQFAGRGVPDVAGDADPSTGYRIQVDGRTSVFGGTSAVAPLWAALAALMNEGASQSVGFLNTKLYADEGKALRDIVAGNNGAYQAGQGWDACTGWGSPIGSAVAALFGASVQGLDSRLDPREEEPADRGELRAEHRQQRQRAERG